MEVFLASFISLFVIVDPLGTSAVFSVLASKLTQKKQRMIAIKAVVIATSVLIFFALCGQFLLENMGISLDSFRIAGGLLLFVTAFRMIMGMHDSRSLESNETCYKDVSHIAIFPLAIPLLGGPGCMTAVILHMSNQVQFSNMMIVIISIITVQAIALISMVSAGKIAKIMGESGTSILARLMGVMLAAMSVQFIVDGVFNIFIKT